MTPEDDLRQLDKLDDQAIAETIRERDANDTGKRLTLDELIRDQGFDPDDFDDVP